MASASLIWCNISMPYARPPHSFYRLSSLGVGLGPTCSVVKGSLAPPARRKSRQEIDIHTRSGIGTAGCYEPCAGVHAALLQMCGCRYLAPHPHCTFPAFLPPVDPCLLGQATPIRASNSVCAAPPNERAAPGLRFRDESNARRSTPRRCLNPRPLATNYGRHQRARSVARPYLIQQNTYMTYPIQQNTHRRTPGTSQQPTQSETCQGD
ncbi:hypothetical protein BD310DRAFT_434693 [Dichomitus squalens]|uniref:Uncharacterized protein n=1 Tax=Dichomitus squalens TaxID=114155 RepID=A0A4Q9PWU9_9APHY|nr:hypothetical protein BD310DRAFT_434693 [Dichomitus squalens]